MTAMDASQTVPTLAEILADPAFYPVSVDFERRVATLAPMTPARYRQVAFHVRNSLSPNGEGAAYDLRALLANPPAPDPRSPPMHYVLHMGLCCSTLLGRALHALPDLLCLREPFALSQVTMRIETERDATGYDLPLRPSPESERWLRLVHLLLQRAYPGARCTVVKTLPQSGPLAPWLLERDARSRALYLYVDPTTFLCQTLRSPKRRRWTRRCLAFTHAGWRAATEALADCEAAAMLWAMRMQHYRDLRLDALGARAQALDGSRLVVDREAALREALAALAIPCDERELAEMLADPLWQTHAKDPPRVYDACSRQEQLERARLRWRPEVRRGLQWLVDHVPWFAPDRPHFGA